MAVPEASKVCSLKDKVALITGASSGIGAGTARLFAKLWAQLALNGRHLDNLRKVALECEECGGKKSWHQSKYESTLLGVIITEVHKRAGLDEEQYKQFLEKCKVTHALGRPGEVEEVAQAIAFLVSDAATFITGVNLPVDRGRHAMCPR